MICQASGRRVLFRLHPDSAFFQLAQERLERALLPADLESDHLGAVEKRDGEEQRRERFPLAALLREDRFDSLREVPEVREAEGLGQVGQGTGAGDGGGEGETHVRERDLAAVLEDEHQIRSGPQGGPTADCLRELSPADAQRLSAAGLEELDSASVVVRNGREEARLLAQERLHLRPRRHRQVKRPFRRRTGGWAPRPPRIERRYRSCPCAGSWPSRRGPWRLPGRGTPGRGPAGSSPRAPAGWPARPGRRWRNASRGSASA